MNKKFPHNKGIKKGDLVLVNSSYGGMGCPSIFIRHKPGISVQYIRLFDLLNPYGYRGWRYQKIISNKVGTDVHNLQKNDYRQANRKSAIEQFMKSTSVNFITTRFNERVWKIPESQLTEGELECYKYMKEVIDV